MAALVVGAGVLAGLGLPGFVLLLCFFVPASALTRGGGRRGAVQVAANGGVATLAAILSRTAPLAAAACAGALAAAAADTWATEIGARSPHPPRLLTTRRPVPPGTSGAVTWLGTAGSGAGAALIATCAALLGIVPWRLAPTTFLAGLAGATADSLLGATVQARYRCPACNASGEEPRHACGGPATLVGGLRWMTNDSVNLAATLIGAAVAVLPGLAGVPLQP